MGDASSHSEKELYVTAPGKKRKFGKKLVEVDRYSAIAAKAFKYSGKLRFSTQKKIGRRNSEAQLSTP